VASRVSQAPRILAADHWRVRVLIVKDDVRLAAAIRRGLRAERAWSPYVGPDGRGEQRGHPQPGAVPTSAALDEAVAARLWAASEEATCVRFALGATARLWAQKASTS
jgi:hypothetical protein